MTMKPFDFVNSINHKKNNMMRDTEKDELSESSYIPFLTNRCLTYFPYTLFYENQMIILHNADNKHQYEYLRNSIRRKKLFAKWVKPEDNDDLEMVKMYYRYSNKKAQQVLSILSSEQKEQIKINLTRGITDERRVDWFYGGSDIEERWGLLEG